MKKTKKKEGALDWGVGDARKDVKAPLPAPAPTPATAPAPTPAQAYAARAVRASRQEGWIALQVRLPPEIHARLEERADKVRGSVNQQIVLLLEQGLASGLPFDRADP